jgi:hypothetical protein
MTPLRKSRAPASAWVKRLLGITMERAAFRFGSDGMRPPIGACSAVITAKVYGRNYEYRPRYYEAQFVLLRASGSHAGIGSSHELTGRLDGMNELGLMIGLHQVKKNPRFPGLSADLIVRMILDQCSTTKQAVERLHQLPHATQYNYSLLDANGVASVVGTVAGRRGTWLACTNHFQSALLRPLNHRRRAAHSQQRLPPGGMGIRWAKRRTNVYSTEPIDAAGIFPWLFTGRRHASRSRRRACQEVSGVLLRALQSFLFTACRVLPCKAPGAVAGSDQRHCWNHHTAAPELGSPMFLVGRYPRPFTPPDSCTAKNW